MTFTRLMAFALGALLVWIICALVHDAHAQLYAHNEAIVLCDRNLVYNDAAKVGERLNENSTLSEYYDTNRDGKVDIETVSYGVEYDDTGEMYHSPYPFMFIVDLNFDEVPDKEYVDIGGHGRCDEIRFYKDLSDAKAPWPDPDVKREGLL